MQKAAVVAIQQNEPMPCKLCGSELPEGHHLEVCDVCMGLEQPRYTCRDCGRVHNGWKNGLHITTAVCRSCVLAKRSKVIKATMLQKRLETQNILSSDVFLVLNFGQHPELLEKIKAIAAANFRTPEAQILWMIRMIHEEGSA